MNFGDPKTQALIWRFCVGCFVAELPIMIALLNAPNPDWRFAAAGLLGGLAAYLDKQLSPQLADAYLAPRENSAPVPRAPMPPPT